MPILTNDLRSPEQRRSDQLTILRRRPPPPRSAGRFFKILADTTASIGAFDPTFDSDAETDGPASGNSIWRRELSRVRSISSTSIGLGPDEKRLPSFHERKKDSDGRAIERVISRNESDDSFVFEGFVRDRATSFYGKGNDAVEVVGEGLSPVSEKELRRELQEDYDMFYHRKEKHHAKPAEPTPGVTPAPAGDEIREEGAAKHETSDEAVPQKKKTGESAQSDSSERAAKSVSSGVASVDEGPQSESLRALRQFRLNDDPDRFTVSVVSEENSDEELEEMSGKVGYTIGGVPLFVEEIGRVPRAAIIDGRVTRVRLSPEKGSFREAVSRARRSSLGFGFGKDGWFRRKSLESRGRHWRRGWWKMKRFLFRHGSEADAREE